MTSPIEPRTPRLYHALPAAAFPAATAVAIVLAAIASYLMLPQLVPAGLSFVVAQAALGLAPLIALGVAPPPRPLARLGLRGARPRFFAAALLIGGTAWYVNARLVGLLGLPEAASQTLQQLVARPPLATAIATLGVLPAVCEELVFRGVLARSLGRALGGVAAVAISATVFSLFHLSIVQALPTWTLGAALGLIAIRADSIAPTILAHAINNAVVVLIARSELPPLAELLGRRPGTALIVAAVAVAAGLALAAFPESPSRSRSR